VPSFGRTLGLPSASSIPIRALRRECDPVNVHGAVRPAIASSSRAPWASTLRCGSGGCHPRPEPPPTRLLHDARSVATGGAVSDFTGFRLSSEPDVHQETAPFNRASLGLRMPTELCNAYRRAGTPASRESSSARGSRLCPRSGFWLAPGNPTPLARDPPPRSPATDVSIRRELCSSGAMASHRPGRARPAFGSGREMTPRSHAF
jgi:hypothetical protein